MDDDGARPLEVAQQGAPVGRIACREDVERALARVDVVQVLGGPVQRQTLDALVLRRQHVLAAGAVAVDAVDDVQDDVRVVDVVVERVKVEADEARRARHDRRHGVGEALRHRLHHVALDELLLRVHQKVLHRRTPLAVLLRSAPQQKKQQTQITPSTSRISRSHHSPSPAID